MRSKVDLPQPDGPSTATTSPDGIARLTSRRTTSSRPSVAYDFETPRSSASTSAGDVVVTPSGVVTPALVVPIGGVRYGRPMLKWKIGDVTVTKIVELEVAGKATWILPDLTAENLATVSWCRPHFATDDGKVVMSVHALVVESQGRRIMVDTCVGNDKTLNIPNWNKRQGPFLTDLAAAGFAADSIDTVLCTHLHVDHVGWNTSLVDGRWVATFPRARYLFGREEWAHWNAEEPRGIAGSCIDDSVRPIVDAGLHQLVEVDHRLSDEISLEPTRGHTPGHVSVRI